MMTMSLFIHSMISILITRTIRYGLDGSSIIYIYIFGGWVRGWVLNQSTTVTFCYFGDRDELLPKLQCVVVGLVG